MGKSVGKGSAFLREAAPEKTEAKIRIEKPGRSWSRWWLPWARSSFF